MFVKRREFEAMRERLCKLESEQAAREGQVREKAEHDARLQAQWDALYAYDGTVKEGTP